MWMSTKKGGRRRLDGRPSWVFALLLSVAVALPSMSCSRVATARSGFAPLAADPTGPAASAAPSPVAAPAAESPTPAPTAIPTAMPEPTPTPEPALDLNRVRPNELGDIPILVYHIIGDEEGRWSRTPAGFRQDLQRLYDAGYRPIGLADLLDDQIDIPAGTSPVVITFDDSSPGQFRFVEKDGERVVDPDCAVGVMEVFHAAHPDFPLKATFFVLPAADPPHNLFGQDEYQQEKLRYLVERGFEIGNHTYWHQRLDEVNDQEVLRQLAMPSKVVQEAVPGYRLRFLALPLGMWPKNRSLAIGGSFEGIDYRHDAVLMAASAPAPSPNSKEYDSHALERVQVFENSLQEWLDRLAAYPPKRYVSDGDPNTITFPRDLESLLNPASLGNRTARAY